MSRIQDILNKAEREGVVRRTHVAAPDAPVATLDELQPPAPPAGLREAAPREASAGAAQGRVIEAGQLNPLLVAALDPHAVAAEQYRTLRTRLMRMENGHARRVLLVTSPGSGDGKSVTAANLALTMAQEFNRRVVLVDADLRRPNAHALLGLPQGPGLADVLRGDVSLEDVLVELPDYRLSFVPAGLAPDRPAELLGSTAMRRTIDALRSRFDRVLVDVPPVLPLADVGVLSPFSDGAVMVVRAGVTPKPQIERALAAFDTDRVVGLVLNGAGGGEPVAAAYGARPVR
jgi:succinoglycan biosynthesis transport protein ExoP